MKDDEEGPGLLEQVRDKFVKYNKNWIDKVFESFDDLEIVGNGYDDDGWIYRFKGCKLKLQRPGVCGDHGGKTKTGAPCKKRTRKDGDGRCGTHPYETIEVSFGDNDGQLRPIPTPNAALAIEGFDDVPVAKRFVSATHIWSEIVLLVKQDIGFKEESWLVHGKERIPVDPLWPSTMLIDMFPGRRLAIEGKAVKGGHRLGDYGIDRFTELTLSVE